MKMFASPGSESFQSGANKYAACLETLFLPVDVNVAGSAFWRAAFRNREQDLTGRCRNPQTANVRFES
jgi:hypothetical protein